MWFQAGADLVVVVHLLFIGFVVGGVFLAWRWPRIVWAHVPAVVYGALVEFAGFTCPLTLLENDLRRRAGEAGYRGGFIDHYLAKVIYPPGLTRGMQIGLGLLVLLVAIIGYRGFARRHSAFAWPRRPTYLPGACGAPPAQGQALTVPDEADWHRPGLEGDRLVNKYRQAGCGAGGEAELISDTSAGDDVHAQQREARLQGPRAFVARRPRLV